MQLRLTTVGPWLRLDLDPRTRSAALAQLVSDRLGDDPALVGQRRELTAALRSFARDATRLGAVYAAALLEVVDGHPVQASVIASYALPSEGPLDGDPTELQLPLGSVTRLVSGGEASFGGAMVPTLIAQYVVSVPDGAQTLLLTFSTPNVGNRAAMLDLFDAIAGAARWE